MNHLAGTLRVSCVRFTRSYVPTITVQSRSMGTISRIFFPTERNQRADTLTDLGFVPGDKEYESFYREIDANPSKLSIETGVPDRLIDDPLLHISVMKYNKLIEKIGITPEKELDFLDNYKISPGVASLEAAHPIPMPHHTYLELPIIKNSEAVPPKPTFWNS
eukprot:TRINITY_DN1135_c0_g1_i1.p1 TRINITY_DN1135_c0_g1~~TRINITY_DN1135_c0_g1_i1.p1  ORF type:complete len:163 (-),score=31.76 TRINITY_DN1135_c0_g1_i1:323-811(-)